MIDTIDALFFKAEYKLAGLSDFDIENPDIGKQRGLKFWLNLAVQSEQIALQYPEFTDRIASEYDRIYHLWNNRRDNL